MRVGSQRAIPEERDVPGLVGQQWGNYRLVRFLGQGGFAEVYLAEHVHLGRQAVVKILHAVLWQYALAIVVYE